MPLVLKYREVAQANIDHFDKLGGFHGMSRCLYHYDGEEGGAGLGCAIGIMDIDGVLADDVNEDHVMRLISDDVVDTDCAQRLYLIQALHDYRTGDWERSFVSRCQKDSGGQPLREQIDIPPVVFDLVKNIVTPEDITPELYKEVMRRLATEP